MQERQNALQNQHLRLTINISHWPRVNVQLGQVFRVQSELHIDGLPVRLQAAFKKAGEMEGILVVRWIPTNSPVLGILRAIKGPWLQKESIQGPCRYGPQPRLCSDMLLHTGHVEVLAHSLGCHALTMCWFQIFSKDFKDFKKYRKITILLGVASVDLAKELLRAYISCPHRKHRYPTTIGPCFALKWSDARVETSNNKLQILEKKELWPSLPLLSNIPTASWWKQPLGLAPPQV